MLKLRETVITEGKYDKITLKNFIETPIITTNGFRIFNDKEKQGLIRKIAKECGILIMTDSDSAGFVIRNFLKGIVPASKIKHCYIPEILGKEKRKDSPSKEGLLGVEGIDKEILISAIAKSGATIINVEGKPLNSKKSEITKSDLYELGLTGRENSAILRKKLLEYMELPTYMTTNAMLEAMNCLISYEKLVDIFNQTLYN